MAEVTLYVAKIEWSDPRGRFADIAARDPRCAVASASTCAASPSTRESRSTIRATASASSTVSAYLAWRRAKLDDMARRGVSEAWKQAAAKQRALREIASGDRSPSYRVRMAPDGRWSIEWTPWLRIEASNRDEAVEAARAVIAAWREIEPDRFEVEIG